ncbi:MAG: sigma-54 dependent transcriptional regulator [Candidatus Krumholzibacteria bacterium]|nr:sigma-54 dependent transcriptional regulator [Candidatus Krumholzibacteria bacterium]
MKPELWTLVESGDATSLLEGLATSEGMTIRRLGSLTEPLGLAEPPSGIVLAIETGRNETAHAGAIRRLRRNFVHFDVIEFIRGEAGDPLIDGADLRMILPADPEDFFVRAARLVALRRIKTQSGIIGRSDALNEMLDTVLQVAPTEVSALVVGESGSGKELTAKAIHMLSRRSTKAFEAINCGALAEGVLESELFGHEKGSFTGAVARRRGLFERADGGTLFLDEVSEMSLGMQVKLLRVIETGEFLRVGGVERLHADVRLVTATNRELETAVERGEFRKDLYYRLRVVQIRVPPLRARPEDIPVLARFFLRQAAARHGKTIRGIDKKGMDLLVRYPWPGNVRELANMIDNLSVLARESMIRGEEIERRLQERVTSGRQGVPDLPVHVQRSRDEVERELILNTLLSLHNDVREIHRMLAESGAPRHGGGRWGSWVEVEEASEVPPADLGTIEREAIREALARNGGNRRKTARQLGMSERTLYRRLREYCLG